MPSFRLDANREIRIADIADIQYMPDIYLRRAAPAGESEPEAVALLTIMLMSGERIRVDGKRATAAWEDFKRATGAAS